MEIADLVNAVAVALANSTDMRNVRIHSMVVEEVED